MPARPMHAFDRAAHRSRWRRRGAGGKALLVLGLLTVTLAGPAPWSAALTLTAALTLAMFAARCEPRLLIAFLAVPAGFLLVSTPLLAVSIAWEQGPVLTWSADGVGLAATVLLRGLAGTACLALLALTTPVTDLIRLLRRIGLPEPVAETALLVYRMVFLLTDAALAGTRAQTARLGYGTTRHAVRSLTRLTAALLLRALDRAERLQRGLALRGFGGALTVAQRAVVTAPAEWALAAAVPGTIALVAWLAA